MQNYIKAIPTEYKGIEFRSKLEAEWAKFMDCLHIDWSYEPEGCTFPDGIHYLPDFYLPKLDMFLEVKGVMTPFDMHKIECLVKYSGKPVIIGEVNGSMDIMTPNPKTSDPDIEGYCIDFPKEEQILLSDVMQKGYRVHFCRCTKCGQYYLAHDYLGWGDGKCYSCGDEHIFINYDDLSKYENYCELYEIKQFISNRILWECAKWGDIGYEMNFYPENIWKKYATIKIIPRR